MEEMIEAIAQFIGQVGFPVFVAVVLRLPMRDGDLSIKGWTHTVAKLDDLTDRSR